MNYRNYPGGGGHSNPHQYPPHSPHSGHHRRGYARNTSQGFNSFQNPLGFGSETAPIPPAPPVFSTEETIIQQEDSLPVVVPATAAELVETTTPAKSGSFNMPSLNEIKGFVDRIGGLDGILTTVGKVQKVVSSVSQMAPLVKVIFGSFKKDSGSDVTDDDVELVPKKRKRRRKPTGSAGRRRKRKRQR
ncbi:hypothetical protein SAMN05216378_3886 [Paenibacillus catalpae]|uniref:YqfQ-like protein n=1 Tax=Paenibacillus catalpae TaxID=1045775 RepID=A0A1I2CYY4_9BACL|nr:hypothetical protein [Paenibacillus catalpae]SFE73537.1 hypothetical protein SAMN05216378_3886 [Paenibacillus catalpae]